MYDLNIVPKSLKDLCIERHGFEDSGNSLQKLWDDMVKSKNLDTDDDIVKEFYDYNYKQLDTCPRDILLNIVASTVTDFRDWPCNSDSRTYVNKFLTDYANNMIYKYKFKKQD